MCWFAVGSRTAEPGRAGRSGRATEIALNLPPTPPDNPPKNKKTRNVPLHRTAVSLLRVRRAIGERACPDCEYIMFNERLGRAVRAFHGAWAKAATACGVHRLFHDLRRTGARNLRRTGVDEKTVMEIGGWKTRDTFLRYNIIDEQDLIEARDKLESQMPAFDPLKKLMAG